MYSAVLEHKFGSNVKSAAEQKECAGFGAGAQCIERRVYISVPKDSEILPQAVENPRNKKTRAARLSRLRRAIPRGSLRASALALLDFAPTTWSKAAPRL